MSSKQKKDPRHSIEDIELDLFLQALQQFHGYNFKNYARDALKRRLSSLLSKLALPHISSLIPLLAHDPDFQSNIANHLTVNYSQLFRDPFVYAKLQQVVFPYLASFPRLNIWVAGCAKGEEAYSIAILLQEAGLLDRSQIYATDLSDDALEQARSGILSQPLGADSALRYRLASGQNSLADYFVAAYDKHKLEQQLLSKIHFEKHNLVQQPGLITAELILCRNVLIYFDRQLQQQVLNSLLDSLTDKGFLVIGTKETLESVIQEHHLTTIDEKNNIVQK